jgi:hypothetical protein
VDDDVAALAQYAFQGLDVEVIVVCVGDERIAARGVGLDGYEAVGGLAVPDVGADGVRSIVRPGSSSARAVRVVSRASSVSRVLGRGFTSGSFRLSSRGKH